MKAEELAAMRRPYRDDPAAHTLTEQQVLPDWLAQFRYWFEQAAASGEIIEPNAMVISTTDVNGFPSSRTVLLKQLDETGFVFFTNYTSRKGQELATNPRASLLFPWYGLHRQVIVIGEAEKVSAAESDAYFAARPRGSQLGALASPQSKVVSGRQQFEVKMVQLETQYAPGALIPRPAYWGGYRIRPLSVEFWQGRPNRLHDRLRYHRNENGKWQIERLAP